MQLAFSTLGCPAWTIEEIVRAAREYGYSGVELRGVQEHVDLRQSPLFAPGKRAQTRRLFEDAGVQICCASASASFANSANRAAAMEEARGYVEIAADLGCPLVRVFGGSPGPDESDEDGMRNLVEALQELAPFAASHSVKIALETHDAFSTGRRVGEALRRVNEPVIGALWDLHHPYRQGESARETFEALAPFIGHTHVKDSNSEGYCLLGRGDVPIKEMVDLLKEREASGAASVVSPLYLCLEWEKRWIPAIAEPEVAFPQYAATLREYLGVAG